MITVDGDHGDGLDDEYEVAQQIPTCNIPTCHIHTRAGAVSGPVDDICIHIWVSFL